MSNDSSSDDEPMVSSPEPVHDDSDSDGSDVFRFAAHKFQKKDSFETPKVKRRRLAPTVEDKLDTMERKQSLRSQRLRERLGERDSDDSSIEVLGHVKGTDTQSPSDSIEIIEQPANMRKVTLHSTSSKLQSGIIDLLDDSSDEETGYVPIAALEASKEVREVLERSLLATSRLRQAQYYHAEDIHVEVQPLPSPVLPKEPKPVVPTPQRVDFGKPLRLTCRCQLEINGKKQPTKEHVLTIREKEPLSALQDKFLKAQDLQPSARVSLHFDGLVLELSRTPTSYEMEDEDLVDVSAKVIAMPKQVSEPKQVAAGPKLTLTFRRKGKSGVEETSMIVREQESFQHVQARFQTQHALGTVSFHFDGEKVNPKQTPADYDMESGDLVDVH